MVNIITSKTKSKRFKPHFNHALGGFYHTKDDYLKDMKKGGFEPYDETLKDKKAPSYKPSKWAHEMGQQIKRDTDSQGNYRPSSNFVSELQRRSSSVGKKEQAPTEYSEKGGFC